MAQRQYLPVVAGIIDPPLFAYIAWLLFDDPVFGAAVGVAIGVSTYMLLAYLYARELIEDGKTPDGLLEPPRGYHRGAAALALVPVGIVPFAWRFAEEDPTVGIVAGLLAGVLVYVVSARVVPREDETIETQDEIEA